VRLSKGLRHQLSFVAEGKCAPSPRCHSDHDAVMKKSLTSLQGPEHQVPQALCVLPRGLKGASLIISYSTSSRRPLNDVVLQHVVRFEGGRIDSTPDFARLVWASCGPGRWLCPYSGTCSFATTYCERMILLSTKGNRRPTVRS
jgi:hypothetical protein